MRSWRGFHRLLVAALLLAALVGPEKSPRADSPAQAGERLYVPAGSRLEYLAVKAPLPARQVGASAVRALDRAAGEESASLPPLHGEPPAEYPPAGWPHALEGEAEGGEAPLAARLGRRDCRRCATEIGDAASERIAALFALRRFDVGDELDEVRLLRLRARYRDGLVAYVNGREVVRRHLARDAGPMEPAERSRGSEWETFYVAVTPGLLRRGENVLALEVRPSGSRGAPRIDVELTGVRRSRIVRGPVLGRVGRTSATLSFETELPARGAVEYGESADRGEVVRSAGGSLARHHRVELTGLSPGSAVHYRAIGGAEVTEDLVFHTAPAPGDVVRFVVYGDMRGGHRVHSRILKSIQEEAPDFVLVTGDLVERGSDEGDWDRFFAVTRDLMPRIPYYPAAGNHDVGKSGSERRRMNEIFALWPGPEDRPPWGHWYSFDVSDIHFVMLDSNAYGYAEQLEWLERDLAEAREGGARAIFAVVHDGPYSRGIHRGNEHAAEHYAPVLAEAGVTLLFSGHDHLYQRGEVKGLRYIVSGGGGAPLYPVRCGVRGRRRCRVDDGMQHVESAHHYIVVVVYKDYALACPKRPDRTPLEECTRYSLTGGR